MAQANLTVAQATTAAINAKMGVVATRLSNIDEAGNIADPNVIYAGGKVTQTISGSLVLTPNAYGAAISAGQSGYNTGTGFWLGMTRDRVAKFSLGVSGGNSITWDGTTLDINGRITADSGTIGGWTIGSPGLVGTTGAYIRSGQTSFDTGTGFWLGDAGGTPKFSVGISGSKGITWDGSALAIRSSELQIGIGTTSYIANGSVTLQIDSAAASPNSKVSVNSSFNCAQLDVGSSGPPGAGICVVDNHYMVGANKVVGARGAAVADATGAGDVVAQLNTLLSRLRTHGLIAT